MKTNYGLLFFNFVISVFMLLSLNSFSTSTMYLPAFFLYFLSNSATFIDKYINYRDLKLNTEKWISLISFLLSIGMICLYISDSLGFTKITFHNVCGTYRMLIQGVPNSFFTFNSVDITHTTLFAATLIPIAYLLFCILAYFRENGLTLNIILCLILKHKVRTFLLFIFSLLIGLSGVQLCYCKYQKNFKGFGEPQYIKYFFVFWILSLFISSFLLFQFYKTKKE